MSNEKHTQTLRLVHGIKSRHSKINCRFAAIDWHGIGAEIREDREFRGVSLRSVASAIGISAPFLSDIERGHRGMSDEVFVRLLDHLSGLPPAKEYLPKEPQPSASRSGGV